MTRLKVLEPERPRTPPRVALVSLTTFCNARCSFCCVLSTLNRADLNPSDERIRDAMVRYRESGCTTLSFTGGEPTVHPRFVELCREGRELGYEAVTINTNGIRFKSRTFTEDALAAGLSGIDFSVHGHTAELHDALVERPGAFDAIVKGAGHLADLAPKYGAKLGATAVVTAANAPFLPELAALLVDLGFRALRFKHGFEGAPGADASLVSRYAEAIGPLREAVALAHRRGAVLQPAHFPLCLLEDEIVFASDLLEESVRSTGSLHAEELDGRASLHRRTSASPCERCLLASRCSRLDERYLEAGLGAELRPLETTAALATRFARALRAYDAHSHPARAAMEALLAVHGGAALHAAPAAGDPSRADPPETESTMTIGFISPSFRVLEINWTHDYEMVKLGAPTVMGHLRRAGHTDVAHWDFDAQICAAMEDDPQAFDLRAYFDAEAVRAFLAGESDGLRAQTEKLLDTLGVRACRVYGISLSAVIDRVVNVRAMANLAHCMAKVLKERHPGCAIVLGGLQIAPNTLHRQYYREFMEACRELDYCYVGKSGIAAVQLLRNIVNGEHDRCGGIPNVVYRDATGGVRFGEGIDFDADLARLDAEFEPERGVKPPVSPVRADSLVRREASDAVHPYELADDGDARQIGPQEYESVPANVPIFDPQLVDQFRYSGLQIMKRFRFDEELMLRFSRFENDRIVVLPHIFVRGCNAPCGFCSYAYTKIQGEEIAQTVAGLRFLSETYQCKSFHFLNTQINSVYQYCEEFCDQLIASKLDILWSDCANMRALDERLLEKLRRAGAMRLVFGVEAPEDSMLKYMHKGIKVDKVERLLRASHDLGIWNHVLLIAGMPHETKAKQDRMMDFLVRTAPIIDFYSISSFYLIASSPWGKNPDKFGIQRISDPRGLLEEQGFDEIADGRWESDGLRWPEKKRQIVESTERFYKTISGAKGQSRCVGGNIDLYLLMFLYSALGHDAKPEIAKIYADTARRGDETKPAGGAADELGPDAFRIRVPVVVGRVNEGDQSQLVHVPFDVTVARASDDAPGFCRTARFSFAHRTPRLDEDGRFGPSSSGTFRDTWPDTVRRVVRLLEPFLAAVDARYAPTSPEQMATLAAQLLPRYKRFVNEGLVVARPEPRGRTIAERNLDWSGLRD